MTETLGGSDMFTVAACVIASAVITSMIFGVVKFFDNYHPPVSPAMRLGLLTFLKRLQDRGYEIPGYYWSAVETVTSEQARAWLRELQEEVIHDTRRLSEHQPKSAQIVHHLPTRAIR